MRRRLVLSASLLLLLGIVTWGRVALVDHLHDQGYFAKYAQLADRILAGRIPLAVLAAILIVVAWNMSEIGRFRMLLKAPRSDIAVLLTTFALTVFADITVAVGVGMVLASLLFMRRMAEVTGISALTPESANEEDELEERRNAEAVSKLRVPPGVEVFQINGPFFFGVAHRLQDILGRLESPPKVFILRMRRVPAIDATGLQALEEFRDRCAWHGTALLLSGVQPMVLNAFRRAGFDAHLGQDNICENINHALERARSLLAQPKPRNETTDEHR